METSILTLHPQGKNGVNIDKAKYEVVRQAIVDALTEHGELTFGGLREQVERRLAGRFEGSVSWYYTTVKLDLEARQVLRRVPGKRPQHVRLAVP